MPVAVPAASQPSRGHVLSREGYRLIGQVAGFVGLNFVAEAANKELKRKRLYETIARIQHAQYGVSIDIAQQTDLLEAYAQTHITGYAAATTADAISALEENFKGRHNARHETGCLVEDIRLLPPQARPTPPTEHKALQEDLAARAAALVPSPQQGNLLYSAFSDARAFGTSVAGPELA